MAAALTYDSLVSDIQVYAERTDSTFVDQIPRFIMMAENRLAAMIHGLGFKRVVTSQFVPGNPIIQKPARWRETAEFSFVDANNQRAYLFQRGYGYLRSYWPDQSVQDTPVLYSDYDYEHWFIAPTPDAALTFEVQYYERPQPLDETNQTSWTTQYAPQLLLYACLLEAQPFLMRPERTQEFMQLFNEAASMISGEDNLRTVGDLVNSRRPG